MKILKSIAIIGTLISLLSFDIPKEWFKAGDKPNSYEMGIAKATGQDGKNAATIKSIDKKIKGFGTLMQQCKADKFLGKRIKMTGYVKSENVKSWAGLWLRVDEKGTNKCLSFDNMGDRPIKGTTGWTKYEIVLDVPKSSSLIAYGALLAGTGQIWFDTITFEIVGDSAEPSKSPTQTEEINEPTNTDFED